MKSIKLIDANDVIKTDIEIFLRQAFYKWDFDFGEMNVP